ncbi:GNAT family N-acetyltransferase [Candidatus Bathyarchaeota archaeon]|nr:GNAT family N-acetyltransferase [Candidatus Bathyarchaeota archaeon]
MYHIKTMSAEDLEFAVQITDTMDWGMINEDFELIMQLEPEGCFTLSSDSERIGIATTISFGKVGWFGNLIVNETHRGKGAGSLLVKHAIQYLTSKNVKTIGLYAYTEKIPFYQRLGFKYDSDFIIMKGKGFSSSIQAGLREAKEEEIKTIIKFDQSCFGASRKKILEPILSDSNNLCYVSFEEGQLAGYVAAKVYEGIADLGPLVCKPRRGRVALALLKIILNRLDGFEISLCIPKKESEILDFLSKSGFSEGFRVARMFYGPDIIKYCMYIAESLERG